MTYKNKNLGNVKIPFKSIGAARRNRFRSASHRRARPPALRNPVDFGGEHEIAFGQSVDLVREGGYFRLAPGQQNVGMVALLFRDRAGAVDEVERFLKIGEAENLVQMMLGDDFPIGQFSFEGGQGVAFERGNAAAAGNAGLVC
jgi:hypothetical protein